MAAASRINLIDQEQLDALLGQAVQDIGAAPNAALIVVGDKLGLYRSMSNDISANLNPIGRIYYSA